MATVQQSTVEERVAQLQREICEKHRRDAMAELATSATSALTSGGVFPREPKPRAVPRDLPESYRGNTDRESKVLEHVERFRKQLTRLYPHRSRLFLAPLNEVGVRKFVSSFVRPVRLVFSELTDHAAIARFVADHVNYFPLEDLSKPPEVLLSPTTLLSWREGSSFDISTLLCSALIGAGYDAYCVAGYVVKDIAVMDLSSVECPLLSQGVAKLEEKVDAAATPYDFLKLDKPNLESQFLKNAPERERAKAEALKKIEADKAAAARPATSTGSKDSQKQLQPNQQQQQPEKERSEAPCVHCWVFVKAPVKGAPDVFIEPSTGVLLPLANQGYIGVESVWNHENVWVNMQGNVTAEGGMRQSGSLSFALHDLDKWDSVFLVDTGHGSSHDESSKPAPTWVSKPEIALDDFLDRFPSCTKTTRYHKCILERFSEHYLGNGLITRITLFDDEALLHAKEIRETFSKRNDLLETRIRQFDQSGKETQSRELFARGKRDSLIEVTHDPTSHTLKFAEPDKSTRIDGLQSLQNVSNTKLVETYTGRADRLIYRSAKLGQPVTDETDMSDKVVVVPKKPNGTLRLLKLTLKFASVDGPQTGKEIEKVSFRIQKGKIDVVYHKAAGKIVPSTRSYAADGSCQVFVAEPLAPKIEPRELQDDFQRLLILKRKAIEVLQANAIEASNINIAREQEEANVGLVLSIYDTRWRTKQQGVATGALHTVGLEESAAAMATGEDTAIEYLRPYLALLNMRKSDLSKELAELLKRACIASYKARLEAREALISDRMAQYEALISRHKEAWERLYPEGRPTMVPIPPEEVAAHKRLMDGADLAMRALQTRQKRLKDTKSQSIAQMEKKLETELS